jgi:long-chain acyl-CoA synthetase
MLDLSRLNCLGEAFRDALLTFNSNIALIEANRKRENSRWTFPEVKREAERLAGRLQSDDLEIGPDDRVAIVMQNQARWVISGIAAAWTGAVLVPIDYKLTGQEQCHLLNHCKPKALIIDYPRWRSIDPKSLPEGLTVFVTELPNCDEVPDFVKPWSEAGSNGFQYVARNREDIATIIYSSGTSGTPKGCLLTHANYLAQAEVLGTLFPMEAGDRYFSILPTNHAIDFMCGFCLPLLFGGTIVHQMTLRPEFLASTMKTYSVTHMSLVPMVLKALERRIREQLDARPPWQRRILDNLISLNEMATARKPNHKISSRLLKPIHDAFGGKLRFMFVGGAFVDRDCAEFFNSLGLPVVIGYGLTEAGTVVTVNDLKPFRGDSVGSVVDGTEMELRHENDAGVGEVWVRGPTVMQGYLDEPELTAEAIVDGWLRTGDLGTIDAAGHLKLMGRAKNMIVTEGGKNVYPEDVEAAFDSLDTDCEELCVFAANYLFPKQTMTGEELAIVVRPKSEESRDELIEEIRQRNRRLADYKRLSRFVLWEEEFPRTASMKIKRNQLAEAIGQALNREEALQLLS